MAAILAVGLLPAGCFAPIDAFAAEGDNGRRDSAVEPLNLDQDAVAAPNEDGAYGLSVSADASANQVDVVFVLDTSGSMWWRADGNSDDDLDQSDKGALAYFSGDYYRLYKKVGDDYVPLADNEDYSGTLYYRSGSVDSYRAWTGSSSSRYLSSSSRLGASEAAIDDMADALVAYNQENPDAVRLSLVQFSTTASTVLTGTADADAFKLEIAKLEADGGTNWQDGLEEAQTVATREGATKVVVFLTDGGPTYYNTSTGGVGGSGSSYSSTGYTNAVTAVQTLLDAGADFYAVGAYESDSRTESLAVDAYGSQTAAGGKYYTVHAGATLSEALASIVESMVSIYEPGVQSSTVGVNIAVSCAISGREWLESDEFTFTLFSDSAGAPMPESDTATIDCSSANHSATFGDIVYTQAGTYYYIVEQRSGFLPDMIYDTAFCEVVVTVSEYPEGELSAMVDYCSGANRLLAQRSPMFTSAPLWWGM